MTFDLSKRGALPVFDNEMESAAETAHCSWELRRIVKLVIFVLRLLAPPSLTSGHDWAESPTHQVKPKKQLSLCELSQPAMKMKVTERIQQRLQHTSGSKHGFLEPHGQGLVLSKSAREILSNSPWTRTSDQIEAVHRELQCCEAFTDYSLPVQKSLCKVGWYQSVSSGRVILKQGHPPSCFYFLLSGAIQVTKKTGSDETVVNSLTAGSSFGDIAIVNDSKRTTTCRAESDVELLVISKSDYLDLSLRQAQKSYQKTKPFEFCKTVHLLKHWPLHLLESHPENCKVNYFKPNAIVVRNSHRCDWIYVVMSGSCRVVKRFVDNSDQERGGRKHRSFPGELHPSKLAFAGQSVSDDQSGPTTLPSLVQKQYHTGDALSRRKTYPRLYGPHTVGSPQALVDKQSPSLLRKQFLVQLQLLQPKDVFGLSAFIFEEEPSVTLVSNGAELVMISKDFISQHITDSMRNKLKKQVVQFPSQDAMLKRIREHHTWTIYKQTMVNQARRRV